jgi:formylglycine-generating enzyme required for sulfatase activity
MRSLFSLVFSLMMLCSAHLLQAQDAKPKLTPTPKPPATQPTKPKTTPKQTIPPSKTTTSPTPAVLSSISANMVYVPGGTFWMGCSPGDTECDVNESPRHQVTLSPYYIGKYEVTQSDWRAVMGSNPSGNNGCDVCPVAWLSRNAVQDFIKKLNQQTGLQFRLPTEAEWEYAARGGNKSRGYKYSGSNDISSVAWYYGNSGDKTHPVGQKQSNELGLYDMTGNVNEWCSDRYGETYYSSSPSSDPQGPWSGEYHVIRGGSYNDDARDCRVSNRGFLPPVFRFGFLFGFRLARD